MNVEIIQADYNNRCHQQDIPKLMQAYATDVWGGAEPIPEHTLSQLVDRLAKVPNVFTLLAYVGDRAVGLANCFENFSTFQCLPLINIHDLVVIESCRGKGVGRQLLAGVESVSLERGCCKITLEVLSNNNLAKAAYEKFGFVSYELSESGGEALFWQKNLPRVE